MDKEKMIKRIEELEARVKDLEVAMVSAGKNITNLSAHHRTYSAYK